jgi:hypothetical protein
VDKDNFVPEVKYGDLQISAIKRDNFVVVDLLGGPKQKTQYQGLLCCEYRGRWGGNTDLCLYNI